MNMEQHRQLEQFMVGMIDSVETLAVIVGELRDDARLEGVYEKLDSLKSKMTHYQKKP